MLGTVYDSVPIKAISLVPQGFLKLNTRSKFLRDSASKKTAFAKTLKPLSNRLARVRDPYVHTIRDKFHG